MIGLRWMDLGPLSDRLQAAGYSAPGERFLSLGGGGHTLLGRWLLGGEGHGLSQQGDEIRRDEFRARITAGYGLFRAGYLLLARRDVSVYPMAGRGEVTGAPSLGLSGPGIQLQVGFGGRETKP